MSSYTISNKQLNPNRVFILQKSELEKRIDPFYYVPELVELEKTVLAKDPKKLRDFVVGISSGATPKTTESEKYYVEKENGIPFLRVQNLSPTGILEFDDCKYINKETHNGMLKRSQVKEGDLLVKITGVGRMAVASVAPEGFEGNINQHICVIRTGNKEISETLAAFLNTDIGEKLASRRATGGTRPALDYPALLSIPIIEDNRILEITRKVVEQKKQNEAEAEKLLSSIDDYLLNELGIKKQIVFANKYGMFSLENKKSTFQLFCSSKNFSLNRLDPYYHLPIYNEIIHCFENGHFLLKKIKDICLEIKSGNAPKCFYDEGNHYLKVRNVRDLYFNWDTDKISNEDIKEDYLLKVGDIVIVTMGAGSLGKCALFNEPFVCQHDPKLTKVRCNLNIVDNNFMIYLLRNQMVQKLIEREIRGSTGMTMINSNDLGNIALPIPPLDKQKEIADHITGIRQQAQQLKDMTKEALKKASEEIENILVG